MSEEAKDMINDMIDQITKTLEDAKTVVTLNNKVNKALGDATFSVRMSVLNMVLCKTILDESDDLNEAMSYVSRVAHTLVEVIDKHVEAQMKEEADETGDPDSPLQ
jgi:oligoribonuclease NrnB/cAMP/cGMP phosphodiesterase (DHH superfamily)